MKETPVLDEQTLAGLAYMLDYVSVSLGVSLPLISN